ncbi:SAM-dependent methyltransferase [Methylophaga frappieri]|uniref:SAM-dependent methyltransferase n=1 Tax=Methylophaga frappieri (strain ATCC BAA-2434 / DSM 25690 / JAM7) TaxID=754477 RepID=I1YK31_METFJ|nr:methyltransferase domain-containing protein [Methylophaga frappieri]AFJ03274.1 SAM-dependent methyltransferase [Methylophaga frappieri]
MVTRNKTAEARMTDWWRSVNGRAVIRAEQNWLQRHAAGFTGHWQIQLGGGERLLPKINRPCHQQQLLSAPLPLSLPSDSVDQLILAHVLEYVDRPHLLLREADRVLAEQGSLIIFAFNPLSWWGLRKLIQYRAAPWHGHFFSRWRLIDWLTLLDFEIVEKHAMLYQLPWQLPKQSRLESWGSRYWPYFGAITVIVARKNYYRLTPLKTRRQKTPMFVSPALAGKVVSRKGTYETG